MRTRRVLPDVRGRTRAVTAVAVTGLAASTLLLTPAGPGQAATGTTVRTASDAPRQIAVADESVAWRPSSNARVKTIRPGTAKAALQVKPKRHGGRKTIWMRSPLSSDVLGPRGTTVTATAQLRTSEPGRKITLWVDEVNRGRVVSSRTASVTPSSRGWRSVRTTLRTVKDGSRMRLSTRGKRMRGIHLVRISDIDVTVAEAPAPPNGEDPPGTPPPAGSCEEIDYSDPAQGVQTFSEEFNGSSLDRGKWRIRDNTFLNHDQAWITKDAVRVHDGYLDIAGKRLPKSQWRTNTQALYPENRTRDYSTGYIDTIDGAGYGNAAGDRFAQKYGHFEVRAWVPTEGTMSRGIWPAFWLRGDRQRGEIDVIESYGAPTIRKQDPSDSYEWNSWADTMKEISKDHTQGTADVGGDKIWKGWHTFGVNWSPGCMRYLYDGRTVGLVEFDDPATKPYLRGPTFDDAFHIRLNMQIGTKYWGWADPQHTRDEFSFRVDWVRVHQGKDLLPAQ